MRKIFYSSRVLIKCCTQEILCAQTPKKLDATLVPPLMILSILYTADADNNRCTWPPPPLLHKRNTALGLLLYFRVDGVQPTQAQSIQI